MVDASANSVSSGSRGVSHVADLFFGDSHLATRLFELAFHATSSTLRLSATRVLCLVLTLMDPSLLATQLRVDGYLEGAPPGTTPSEEEGRNGDKDGAFLLGLIRAIGCLSNPYSTSRSLTPASAGRGNGGRPGRHHNPCLTDALSYCQRLIAACFCSAP